MNSATSRSYLLALDGSVHANRAVEYLVRRAALLGSVRVHLVTVLAPRLADLVAAQQRDLLFQAGSESEHARGVLDAAGIAYRFHGEIGDPARRIVQIAGDEGCDEIIMGSRGQSALNTLALGSVAHRTIRLATVPVTVVPNPRDAMDLDLEDGEQAHRVLLCVDGSAASQLAVEYVCGLRDARIPLDVRLLNVQSEIASGNVKRFVAPEVIDAYYREQCNAALEPAVRALREAGLAFDSRCRVGNAAHAIVREALLQGCTRIVMGAKGRTPLGDVVVGSTALGVLHQSEMPVTLVK